MKDKVKLKHMTERCDILHRQVWLLVLLLVPLEQPKLFTTVVRDAAALPATPPTPTLTTRAESSQELLLGQPQPESQLINIANAAIGDRLFLDPLTRTTTHLIVIQTIILGESLQELHWEQLLLV